LASYEVKEAGGREHLEYWIPSEDLPAFNEAIVGRIEVIAEFTQAGRCLWFGSDMGLGQPEFAAASSPLLSEPKWVDSKGSPLVGVQGAKPLGGVRGHMTMVAHRGIGACGKRRIALR
jgi:hypothetical protein